MCSVAAIATAAIVGLHRSETLNAIYSRRYFGRCFEENCKNGKGLKTYLILKQINHLFFATADVELNIHTNLLSSTSVRFLSLSYLKWFREWKLRPVSWVTALSVTWRTHLMESAFVLQLKTCFHSNFASSGNTQPLNLEKKTPPSFHKVYIIK